MRRNLRIAVLAAAIVGVVQIPTAPTTQATVRPIRALDVWFNRNAATVNRDGAFRVAGYYTCQDPDPDRGARLRIYLIAENNAEGGIDLSGPCGVSAAPWNATIPPDADSPERFVRGVPTEARATLTLDDAVGEEATDEAIMVPTPCP